MAAGEGGEEKDWKRKKRKSVNLEVELERLDFFFQPCPHPLSLPLVSLSLFTPPLRHDLLFPPSLAASAGVEAFDLDPSNSSTSSIRSPMPAAED